MNGWLAAEAVVTVALIVVPALRTSLGRRYVPLSIALSIASMMLCIGEWMSAGSGAWTVALGVVAVVTFAIAWMRHDRAGRADAMP